MAKKKASKPAEKPAAKMSGITMDPNLPLLPGNSVTFIAETRAGLISASVTDPRGTMRYSPSVSQSGARISKIIEVAGPHEVTFFEDGKAYASGTFED